MCVNGLIGSGQSRTILTASCAIVRIGGACRYNGRACVVLSTWDWSLYRVAWSRYIECGAVDISTDADSSYRLADVAISVSRPSAGDHQDISALSAGWLQDVGMPIGKESARRQGQGRHADMYQPSRPTWTCQPADIPPPGPPTLMCIGGVSDCQGIEYELCHWAVEKDILDVA